MVSACRDSSSTEGTGLQLRRIDLPAEQTDWPAVSPVGPRGGLGSRSREGWARRAHQRLERDRSGEDAHEEALPIAARDRDRCLARVARRTEREDRAEQP